MSTPPKYVLITPARNEVKFIELTLKSMVAQTAPPLKWVIVSDGSTDGRFVHRGSRGSTGSTGSTALAGSRCRARGSEPTGASTTSRGRTHSHGETPTAPSPTRAPECRARGLTAAPPGSARHGWAAEAPKKKSGGLGLCTFTIQFRAVGVPNSESRLTAGKGVNKLRP